MEKMTIIGVMGGGEGMAENVLVDAERLGELVAEKGWVLLNGGRKHGVMEASAKGASSRNGLTIGVLPYIDNRDNKLSSYIAVPIFTGMGIARNAINILSSDVVIACAGSTGTISEVAMALKNEKSVIFMGFDDKGLFRQGKYESLITIAATPEEAVQKAAEILGRQ